jgi:hypothetical protein
MLGELVECFLDSGLLGFGVDDEVVFLRVWGFGDMLYNRSVSLRICVTHSRVTTYSDTSQQDTGHRILSRVSRRAYFS